MLRFTSRSRGILGAMCIVGAGLWLGSSATAAGTVESEEVQYRWVHDPELNVQWWPAEAKPVLRVTPERLKSGSATDRLEAAQAIVRLGNRDTPARAELLQALLKHLARGEPQRHVRAAYAAAACRLDDGSHAEQLWKFMGDDALARPAIEQAFIDWGSPAPLTYWREQLVDRTASESSLLRALNGIGAAGAASDLAALVEIVTDATRDAAVRLVAAKAIGRLSPSDQLVLAQRLRTSSATGDLMALYVLGRRSSPEINAFVLDVAQHGGAPAQRHAYQWLCELQPEIAQSKAMEFAQHSDAEIRRLSLEQIQNSDGGEAIASLTATLSDIHPTLRHRARELLQDRAGRGPEHRQAVEGAIAEQLRLDQWRPLEQTLRLAVDLELDEHVPRMLELLDHPRPEVCITAAWALRHLASDEQALEAMLEHARVVTAKLESDAPQSPGVEEPDLRRTAHLLEAFGIRRYAPAQEVLLKYVPKNGHRMGMITRIAGIWACGKMWEGKENRSLADELCARIADESVILPEFDTVRYTAMLALGFLADPATRSVVETHGARGPAPIGAASAWALRRIDAKR